MIIYNHVVNQCEDQKLILSQIFNTPIYKPNYSCIEFQDFEVTWGGKSHTEVISSWCHLGSIEIDHSNLPKNSFNITEFQHLKVTVGGQLGVLNPELGSNRFKVV